jgi:hypothetical protein
MHARLTRRGDLDGPEGHGRFPLVAQIQRANPRSPTLVPTEPLVFDTGVGGTGGNAELASRWPNGESAH